METDNSPKFIPQIVATAFGGDRGEARRRFRNAVETALHSTDCAQAIAPFKANGHRFGHKVLDNFAALEALRDKAPKALQDVLKSDALTEYEKTQQLDNVLRRYWVIDRHGKIDGTPSQRFLTRQARQNA